MATKAVLPAGAVAVGLLPVGAGLAALLHVLTQPLAVSYRRLSGSA